MTILRAIAARSLDVDFTQHRVSYSLCIFFLIFLFCFSWRVSSSCCVRSWFVMTSRRKIRTTRATPRQLNADATVAVASLSSVDCVSVGVIEAHLPVVTSTSFAACRYFQPLTNRSSLPYLSHFFWSSSSSLYLHVQHYHFCCCCCCCRPGHS